MILCNNWQLDPMSANRVNIFGLLSNIDSHYAPAFPMVHPDLCVFLSLTEVRSEGTARIKCVHEETGELAFQTSEIPIRGGDDPLAIIGVPIRIRQCRFPRSGIYSIQFWYNDEMVQECPLRLRSAL
jgi:hypothetical protein